MTRPAYSFCICPDSGILRSRIETLLATHPPEGNASPWRRFSFWGDEGLPPAFWEHLTLQGLFATPKAIILRNAQNVPADTLRPLFSTLEQTASSAGASLTWPLICLEVAFEKGKAKIPPHIQKHPAFTRADKAGWADYSPGLEAHTLTAHIQAEAKRKQLALSREQLFLLAKALPPDAARIASELDKLALLADQEGRLPEAALACIEQSQEISIFELLRGIQQRQENAPAVWRRILEDRLSGENMVFAFNAVVLREARQLWQLLAGESPPMPPSLIAQKRATAQNLGFAGISRLWELALTADKGIKSGEFNPEQAFEMLAAQLFLLFSQKR